MGWPQKVEPALSLYFACRNELTIEENCLLRGIQVVVTHNLHERVLHESHLGVVKMKAISHVWWPGIDKALEEVTKHCEKYQTNHKEDLKTPLHTLEFTSNPWQTIHLDFDGPFQGQFLVDTNRFLFKTPRSSTNENYNCKSNNKRT